MRGATTRRLRPLAFFPAHLRLFTLRNLYLRRVFHRCDPTAEIKRISPGGSYERATHAGKKTARIHSARNARSWRLPGSVWSWHSLGETCCCCSSSDSCRSGAPRLLRTARRILRPGISSIRPAGSTPLLGRSFSMLALPLSQRTI
jgi:hypothetical protein